MKNRFYIIGPMTGYPNHNYPAFCEAEKMLQEFGHNVLNPASNFGGRDDLPYDWYIREDMKLMSFATDIALLPGWDRSRGGQVEYHFATLIGLPMIEITSWGYQSHYPTMRQLIENLEAIHEDAI